MSDRTTIEWTRTLPGFSGATWNPVRGCDPCSPGCKHCYAKTFAERFRGVPSHAYEQGFDLRLVPDKLAEPLRWTCPRLVFVNSMSDLLHPAVCAHYVLDVWEVMRLADWHVFQVLTKRADRLPDLLARRPVLPNVWVGVSVENRKHGLPRIDRLRDTPAAVRFLSVEPLLEDLGTLDLRGIDWVIVGGESGRGARPMHPAWARSIRDQALAAGAAFFFKQWGAHAPWQTEEWFTHGGTGRAHTWVARTGERGACWIIDDDGMWSNWTGDPPDDPTLIAVMSRLDKGRAGRVLDGRTHDQMPAPGQWAAAPKPTRADRTRRLEHVQRMAAGWRPAPAHHLQVIA